MKILLLGILIFLSTASLASATTITVCQPPGTCQNTTINGGIGMASPGDTILIGNLNNVTYKECVNVTKDNLTLNGSTGENRPVIYINFSLNCPAISVYGHNVTLDHLTIYGDNESSNGWSAAITSYAKNNLTIDNVTIVDSILGIDIEYSNNTIIKNSRITANDKPLGATGIAILIGQSTNVSIFNNVFNATNDTYFYPNPGVYHWNATNQTGPNIAGGYYIGGNLWLNSSGGTGTGFSETCNDANQDGYCDSAYNVSNGQACTPGVSCGAQADFLPISTDRLAPNISISSPANGSSTDDNTPLLNVTITDNVAVDQTWWILDSNGTINTGYNTSISLNLSALLNGPHNITVFSNDTYGNQGSQAVYFTIVALGPNITLIQPANTTYVNDTMLDLSFSASENLSACWYSLDSGSNITTSCGNQSDIINATGNGLHNITLYANDSLGNTGSNSTNFTISCTESWTASAWSACSCSTSTQSRTLSDQNSCGTTDNKTLSLSQSCTPSDCGGGGGGGGAAAVVNASNRGKIPPLVKIWDKIGPGAAINFSLNKTEYGFSEIRIDVQNPVKNIVITVTKLDGKPAEVTKEVTSLSGNRTSKVYQYVSINATNLNSTDIKSSGLSFDVSKAWISANSIDKNKVYLNRYASGSWVRLTTRIINEDSQDVHYQADSPGFSTFAITGDVLTAQSAPQPPSQANQTTAPAMVCSPGEKRCVGMEAQACNQAGTGFSTSQICDFACVDGTCTEKPQVEYNYTWLIIAIVAAVLAAAVIAFYRHRISLSK